jgi:hypothetical protein
MNFTVGGMMSMFWWVSLLSIIFFLNNAMIKTIKTTALFSDLIGRFTRADWPVLGNDGGQQDGKAAGY